MTTERERVILGAISNLQKRVRFLEESNKALLDSVKTLQECAEMLLSVLDDMRPKK